jgi:hypothetical protein
LEYWVDEEKDVNDRVNMMEIKSSNEIREKKLLSVED